MKKFLALVALCALMATAVAAQNSKLTSKMLYHNGPVLTRNQNFYFIWYGCWDANCGADIETRELMFRFSVNLGNSAASTFIYGGEVIDSSYSHGVDLTPSDITSIISDLVNSFRLPQDSNGIYVIVSSADIASTATGFCNPSTPPYHSTGIVNGSPVNYIFLGNPKRCPTVAGPQFSPSGPTPNNNYVGDVLIANFAHALNGLITNPLGNGWFDRYGLENADKCQDALGHPSFGQTYRTANGARANVRMGGMDFLIPQNWVNDRKPRCALSR